MGHIALVRELISSAEKEQRVLWRQDMDHPMFIRRLNGVFRRSGFAPINGDLADIFYNKGLKLAIEKTNNGSVCARVRVITT